ncbi:unnamed protein product, partial [Timema podura]|nr:unnamed protein product [Timema podura]
MERILKRNHPNSISALILTANSDVEAGGTSPRVKYLENRIQQLEQELQTKETEAASSFQKIQDQFHSMKSKYEAHIADLELELAAAKHQANMRKLAAEKTEPAETRPQIGNNKDLTKVRDLQESSEDLEVLVSFMKSEVEKYKSLSTNNNSKRTGSLVLKSSSILNQEVDRYRSEVERQDATIKTLNRDLELARDSLEAKKNELIAVVSESRLQLETLEMRLCDIQATLKKERMEAKKYALEKEEDKKTVKDLTRQ